MRDNLELSAQFQIHTGCRVHQLLIKQWLLIIVSLKCCCDELQIFGLVVLFFFFNHGIAHLRHGKKQWKISSNHTFKWVLFQKMDPFP